MKVQELIQELKRHDPSADVVLLGHRNFFYPVASIQKQILKPTAIFEVHTKIGDAYRDGMKNDECELCIELIITG